GSNSCLSICSPSAVEWVSKQIGKRDFVASAHRLSSSVMGAEPLDRRLQQKQTPEPDMETALRWTNAYFGNSLDAIFAVLDRHEFEARLRADFESNTSNTGNKSWYALRNIVYASGCRIVLSEEATPAAFAASRTQSWRYYENALSVHTELLYSHVDLDSIRALLIMAFYAEALGTPGLEYMHLSSAVRLAQSKSLNLQTPGNSHTRPDEVASRHWIWWILYSYDKHLAYRSGCPSAIDDDYISAPIPTHIRGSNDTQVDFALQTIAHARIASTIAKDLTSAQSLRSTTPEDMMRRVQALDGRLREWRESLNPAYRVGPPFKSMAAALPPGTHHFHALFMHFSYNASLIATHTVFCYPWNRHDIQSSENPEIHGQILASTETVAEASRQIILGVQRLEITAALPSRLTFYYPLVGLVNLFIYVLKNPLAASAMSDLSLMDIVVGHFGYLEFVSSSELVFSFPREVTSYARGLVQRAKEAPRTSPSSGGGLLAIPGAGIADTQPDWAQMPFPAEVGAQERELLNKLLIKC
ncbi:hypothetical protein GQ53DRAFT_875270, partial [Thozetella sp. PMI_491]